MRALLDHGSGFAMAQVQVTSWREMAAYRLADRPQARFKLSLRCDAGLL